MKKIIALFLVTGVILSHIQAQNDNRYLDITLSDRWSEDEKFTQTLPAQDRWWLNFNDPILDSLITVASVRNHSVLSALENMRIAKASWRIAQAGLFPRADLNGEWQRGKTSGNTSTNGYKEAWDGFYDATISITWQIDLFGAIYKRSQSEKYLFHASEEEYRGVMVSLCADVATTYFSLKQSLAEMDVLRDNVASQKEILNIVEVRYGTGLASKLDVAQARSVYYSTLAAIPSMEAAIQQYSNALAVLTANRPGDFINNLELNSTLPDYIDAVAVGIPANLIRRRPDVLSAEKRVDAYASLHGASKRDWLPQFFLNGSLGFESSELKYLPRANSSTWQIAPSVSWNLFSGGERKNATKRARAQLEQSIIEYNNTILVAMNEVENAMTAYKNSIRQIAALRETVNQGKETLQLSLELYKQGLTPFQNVLDAQRTLLNYQDYLVQAQGNSLTTLVELYKALGGGW